MSSFYVKNKCLTIVLLVLSVLIIFARLILPVFSSNLKVLNHPQNNIFSVNKKKKIKSMKTEKIIVSKNGHFLMKENGKPFFPIADTAWKIAWRLNKNQVQVYLEKRKNQKFNTIALVAFPMENVVTNVYGKQPFEVINGKYDVLKPIVIPNEYDYWDNLEYVINSAETKGFYVILLPAWGGRVAGDYGNGHPNNDIILNTNNAFKYAKWLSARLKKHNNIIWMIGGDRNAVYGKRDYRKTFREIAKGILVGSDKPVLMSYHPRKWQPNSSEWFHNDSWLSFNSIQDQPSDQIKSVRHDYNLSPVKPTWLFEGGYEERGKSAAVNEVSSKRKNIYNDWQVRFQAYQTVFAGAFGYTYGHMSIWDFLPEWEEKLDSPGANDMRHLSDLISSLTDEQFFSLTPDQSIIVGETGSMSGNEGMFSSSIVATRSNCDNIFMIYAASGNSFKIDLSKILVPTSNQRLRARWFNPRDGEWTLISDNISNEGKIVEFDPPGKPENGNDWVLVIDGGN